jgi:adenosylhomocysteine nucleosidase
MIAIIGVAREEIGYFQSLTEIKSRVSYAGMEFSTGIFENSEVVLVCTGMGQIPTTVAAQIAIDRFDARLVISGGPAAPLVPYLQQGDMVVADKSIQYDTEKGVLYQNNEIPGDSSALASGPELTTRLTEAYNAFFGGKSSRPQLVVGAVISSDRIIRERRTIGLLLRDYGAVALDRDGATLARVCKMNSIPFILLRTIVDTPDGDFYNYFDSQLQVVPEYITGLVGSFLAAPPPIPVL